MTLHKSVLSKPNVK